MPIIYKSKAGFTTLTLVIIVSAFISFLLITRSQNDMLLAENLMRAEVRYEKYYHDESCRNLELLAEVIPTNPAYPVCTP
jgi:hypothetical protein